MFARYFQTLSNCFKIPELRSRIIFTLLLLLVCRLIALVPVPGLDGGELANAFADMAKKTSEEGGNTLLGMYSMFTGGAMERCGLGSLGIMPYISATIILQLMTAVVPSLSKLSREEGGRTQIIKYGRYLTVLLCLGQGYVMSMGWEHPDKLPGIGQVLAGKDIVIGEADWWYHLRTTLLLTTGTVLLMWLGEQITERGIGNGISLVITVGIISRIDTACFQFYEMFKGGAHPFKGVLLVVLLFAVVGAVIAVTQAMRKIPVQYAQRTVGRKQYQGGSTYFPLRVNYAGVMPIIFAQALLMFPAQIFQGLASMTGMGFFQFLSDKLAWASPWFLFTEGMMILFFSYFWVATQFNETQIADDLKKGGGYIPGVRPGNATRDFLHHAMSRLTLAGAMFLVAIAILPTILADRFDIPMMVAQFFGGTSVLIMVGVMLDTMRQVESHLAQRHYDGFLKSGKVRGRFN